MILKKIIKLIPGTVLIHNYFLEKKLLKQFLKCSLEELEQLNFYKRFIKHNDLVFDVGCNVGSRAKLFLNAGARVVAFEPQMNLCDHLHSHLHRSQNFHLEMVALGEKSGSAEIKISDAHVLSSMSDRWISNTKKSGRFRNYTWNKLQKVTVSTLDYQIRKHGLPKFIKIDVEGFELEVLKGLSQPVDFISFEFTAEDFHNSTLCIDKICKLGNYSFQYSLGESLSFDNRNWVTKETLIDQLTSECTKNPLSWGDIYARNCITIDA